MALPIAALLVKLNPYRALGGWEFGGWPLPVYVAFFLYGFLLMSHDGMQRRVEQQRWISLALIGLLYEFLFAGSTFCGFCLA